MSPPSDQPSVWTPEIIATIVYRVVMTIVSILFLWKQYQRYPIIIDEEQYIEILHRHPSPSTTVAAQLLPPPINPRPSFPRYLSSHTEVVASSALGLEIGSSDHSSTMTTSTRQHKVENECQKQVTSNSATHISGGG